MAFLEWTLLAILLASALFIIIAVIFQKSADEGLSGTIAGGNETFYGKEKSAHTDKLWFKLTLIVSIVFVVAVLVVYIIQPDYTGSTGIGNGLQFSEYAEQYNEAGHQLISVRRWQIKVSTVIGKSDWIEFVSLSF